LMVVRCVLAGRVVGLKATAAAARPAT
jgi:hypothetical protein